MKKTMTRFPARLFKRHTDNGAAQAMEKYLIVGLGNPGDEYAGTRHNAGWMAADALAEAAGAAFEDKRYGFVAQLSVKGRRVILLKPTTFMNLSGNAVRYWLQKEKIDTSRLLVIVDDIALETGKLRMKGGGSSGGHNGLAHISSLIGEQFARLRIGIGNGFERGGQISWVLGKFSNEERAALDAALKTAVEEVHSFVLQGVDRTMNAFNGK